MANILSLTRMSDTLTVFSACLGFLSVAFVATGELEIGASLVMVCALIDGLDGLVARWEGGDEQRMRFGVMLDSFSDTVAFCVSPALMTYLVLARDVATTRVMLDIVLVACALYVACGIMRLSRFNVLFTGHPRTFEGLPTTASGLLLASVVLLEHALPAVQLVWLHGVLLSVLSALMISSLPYPKPTNVRVLGVFALVPVLLVVSLYASLTWLVMGCALLLTLLMFAYLLSPLLVRTFLPLDRL